MHVHTHCIPALAVLQDVIKTMYNQAFISELFRPQDVYSMHSTRQIFDRLAHSSIMRLNEQVCPWGRPRWKHVGLLPQKW